MSVYTRIDIGPYQMLPFTFFKESLKKLVISCLNLLDLFFGLGRVPYYLAE